MGACVSNNQQLINEINKPENRKFILENLNLTQQDLINAINNSNNINNKLNTSPINDVCDQLNNTNSFLKNEFHHQSQNFVGPSTSTTNNGSNCRCNCACHQCKSDLANNKCEKKSYNSLVFKIIAFDENNDLTLVDTNSDNNSSDINLNECINKLKKNNKKICLLLNSETNSLNIITKSAKLNNLIANSSSDDNVNKNDIKKSKLKLKSTEDVYDNRSSKCEPSIRSQNRKSTEISPSSLVPNYIKERGKPKSKKSVNTQTSHELYPDETQNLFTKNNNHRHQHDNLISNKFPISSNPKSNRSKSNSHLVELNNSHKSSLIKKKQIHFDHCETNENDRQNRSNTLEIRHICNSGSENNGDRVIDIIKLNNDSDRLSNKIQHKSNQDEEFNDINIDELDDYDAVNMIKSDTKKELKILNQKDFNNFNKSNKNLYINNQKQIKKNYINNNNNNNELMEQIIEFPLKNFPTEMLLSSNDICSKCHKNNNEIRNQNSQISYANLTNEHWKTLNNKSNEMANKKSNRVHFLNNNENSKIIKQNQQQKLDLFYKRDINYDFYNNNYNINNGLLNNDDGDSNSATAIVNSTKNDIDYINNSNGNNKYIQNEDKKFEPNNKTNYFDDVKSLKENQELEINNNDDDNDVNDIDAYLDNYCNQSDDLIDRNLEDEKLSDIFIHKNSLDQINNDNNNRNSIHTKLEASEIKIKNSNETQNQTVIKKKSIKDSHKFNSFYDNLNEGLIRDENIGNKNNENKEFYNINQQELENTKEQKLVESNNLIINIQELNNVSDENVHLKNKKVDECLLLNQENSQIDQNISLSSTTLNSFTNNNINKIELDSSILAMECENDAISKLDDSMNSIISNVLNKSIKLEDDNDEIISEIIPTTIVEMVQSNLSESCTDDKNSRLNESLKDDISNVESVDSFKLIEKLKLNSIVNSVGFFIFPSASLINIALKTFLIENRLYELFESKFKIEFTKLFNGSETQRFAPPCYELIDKFINYLIKTNDLKMSLENFQKRLGYLYLTTLFGLYENELKSIGSTMQKYFNILNSFHEALINHKQFGQRFLYLNEGFTGYTPSFKCEIEKITDPDGISKDYKLIIVSIQENATPFLKNFYQGVIEATAKKIWNLDVIVDKLNSFDILLKKKGDEDLESIQMANENDISKYAIGYTVKINDENKQSMDYFISGTDLSDDPNDSFISVDTFKSVFPFSILIDHELNIRQVGDGLIRHLGQSIKQEKNLNFLNFFAVVTPKLNEYTFESILINDSMSYTLKMKSLDNLSNSQLQDMELKGSMMFIEESGSLLFIGSPVIQHLEELTGRGLYISDIPIHDATRDIILVGEQTKAQEGLKFRMEKLKQSIVKTGEDIEEEKRKNIELLNMIFPSDIAKQLWRGEKVSARSIINVTLLYSDIVGFTSICSTAQPIEIIEMLKRLYTDFDNYCGLLDIYKIETIGDAYVAAGGLHKPSPTHAQQMAWMSLLMMESASNNINHKGEKIKMRIGLHTGDVLAGIVGIKQPRYCLFGNNCTIANKFESMSEEKRIHVSPITKKFLDNIPGFELEPRDPEYLPENIVDTDGNPLPKEEVSWFLNSYKFKNLSSQDTLMSHIQFALKEYNIE